VVPLPAQCRSCMGTPRLQRSIQSCPGTSKLRQPTKVGNKCLGKYLGKYLARLLTQLQVCSSRSVSHVRRWWYPCQPNVAAAWGHQGCSGASKGAPPVKLADSIALYLRQLLTIVHVVPHLLSLSKGGPRARVRMPTKAYSNHSGGQRKSCHVVSSSSSCCVLMFGPLVSWSRI
jgi:hypothetical protein